MKTNTNTLRPAISLMDQIDDVHYSPRDPAEEEESQKRHEMAREERRRYAIAVVEEAYESDERDFSQVITVCFSLLYSLRACS